jgi:leucyl aminopeptidase (aminopeptidase T)
VSKPDTSVALSAGEAANKSWFVFKHYNPGSATDPRLAYVTGYRRAVADMLMDQIQLGGWDSLTRRLLDVLEYLAGEREAVRMVTEDYAVQDEDGQQ